MVNHTRGMDIRRHVLGNEHVDRAIRQTTSFDEAFQEFITEGAWEKVWARPGLTLRERSLVTVALLAALGHDKELAMHVRACLNTGATRDDLIEVLLHVAVYAGVPAANRAIAIAKQTLQELEQNEKPDE